MTLNKRWTVYKDPTYAMVGQPAGADLVFRVKTIEKLQWLHSQAATIVGLIHTPVRELTGFSSDGKVCASFRGFQFHVSSALGQVDTGVYEVEGLKDNEAYEAFLLNLTWRSRGGWLSEMHVLGLAADDTLEGVYDEPSKDE